MSEQANNTTENTTSTTEDKKQDTPAAPARSFWRDAGTAMIAGAVTGLVAGGVVLAWNHFVNKE